MSDRLSWKPGETVEFKHVFELTSRLDQRSQDGMLVGAMWNQWTADRVKLKHLRAAARALLCVHATPAVADKVIDDIEAGKGMP